MSCIRASRATAGGTYVQAVCRVSVSRIWIAGIQICALGNIVNVGCGVSVPIHQFNPVICAVHRTTDVIGDNEILDRGTWTQHVILDWLNQPRISLILIHDLGRVVHCQVGHVKITGGADSTVKDFHATPWSIIRVVNEESPIRDTGCSRVAPRCCGVLVG